VENKKECRGKIERNKKRKSAKGKPIPPLLKIGNLGPINLS
jgi:hypothetical protein